MDAFVVFDRDVMKTLLLALVAGSAVLPVQAQLFGPESLGGAVLGGIAGGVIGHNNGRRTAEGAAIGAGVGAVLGAIVGNERRAEAGHPTSFISDSPNPPRAVTGALLGGIAGGVIGHNNGRRTAEGIAIGAGAGLLLGTLADQAARPVPPPAAVVHAYPGQVGFPPPTPCFHGPHHRHFVAPPPQVRWVQTVAVASQDASPTVPNAPVAPAAPVAFEPAAPGSLTPANALFGR